MTAADCAGEQSVLLPAQACRFSAPDDLAGFEIQREQSAALLGIQSQAEALWRFRVRHAADADIGDGHVNLLAVRCRAPLAAAQIASSAGAGLPEDFAFFIGIDRMHHAGFLRDDQRALSLAETDQDRRLPEVEILTVRSQGNWFPAERCIRY